MKRSVFVLVLGLVAVGVNACSAGSAPGGDGGIGGDAATAPGTGGSGEGSDSGTASGDGGAGTKDGGSGSGGAVGLEGFCEHYIECGGSYYADVKACIDASEGHWGVCRRPELDAFGTCMMKLSCSEWNPDAYNPSSTPCAKQWSAVGDKSC